MAPAVLAGLSLLVATAALAVVLVQPRQAWRDAAEHTRAFWVSWALVGVGVGLAGPVMAGVGWAGASWLAGWVAVGSAEPSMISDVLEVRRLRLRRRQAKPPPTTVEPPLRPIRWRAPALAGTASGPPGRGGSERRTA